MTRRLLARLEPGLQAEGVIEMAVGVHDGVQRRFGVLADLLVHRLGGFLVAGVHHEQPLGGLEDRDVHIVGRHEEGLGGHLAGLALAGEEPLEDGAADGRVDIVRIVHFGVRSLNLSCAQGPAHK